MRRTGVLAVAAATLMTVAACGAEEGPDELAAAAPSSTEPAGPNAELLVDLPQLTVPETFDATAGFALRTGTGVQAPEEPGLDTWELTEFGVASYVVEAGGPPVIESTTLTGVSQWRVEVTDPLTPHPDPLVQPHLYSVLGEERTWLALVEYGSQAGSTDQMSRLTTYDAETGELGVRSSVPGAQAFTGKGGNLVFQVYRDPTAAESPSTVFIDPETGGQTRHDPVPGENETSAWEDLVLDVHDGTPVVLRTCVVRSGKYDACPTGPTAYLYGGEVVPHSNEDGVSHPGLYVTPGGTTVGYLNLTTGKELPTTCTGPEDAVWSPSGRYASIAGNVIDFEQDTSVCLGRYPSVYAIDDQALSYGKTEAGEPATVNSLTGAITVLPAGTMLPSGIGAGGYGVFRTDTAVVVLPPR
jgi:hypothetical protein